jgi:hypothetical protein
MVMGPDGATRNSILPTSQTPATSVGKIDVSSPDFTYMQMARVGTTGPTGRSNLPDVYSTEVASHVL